MQQKMKTTITCPSNQLLEKDTKGQETTTMKYLGDDYGFSFNIVQSTKQNGGGGPPHIKLILQAELFTNIFNSNFQIFFSIHDLSFFLFH